MLPHLTNKYNAVVFLSLVLAALYSGCSSEQQEQVQEQVTDDAAANQEGQDEAASSENDTQEQNNNQAGGNEEDLGETSNAELNDDTQATSENNIEGQNATENVGSLEGSNQEMPAADAAVAEQAANTATSSVESGAYQPSSSDRVVRYVLANNVWIREQPNNTARTISQLEKGDHMLVSLQGDWAQRDDGTYVNTGALSEKAIPRDYHGGEWFMP